MCSGCQLLGLALLSGIAKSNVFDLGICVRHETDTWL
jgi:hypothetical protein